MLCVCFMSYLQQLCVFSERSLMMMMLIIVHPIYPACPTCPGFSIFRDDMRLRVKDLNQPGVSMVCLQPLLRVKWLEIIPPFPACHACPAGPPVWSLLRDGMWLRDLNQPGVSMLFLSCIRPTCHSPLVYSAVFVFKVRCLLRSDMCYRVTDLSQSGVSHVLHDTLTLCMSLDRAHSLCQ